MDRTLEVISLFLLCALRFGVPLGITFLLAWGLRRLDAHWQAEAELKIAKKEVRQIAVSQERCWELRNCSPQKRETCPAYAHPEEPCWAVVSANGHLPRACRDCHVLGRALVLAGM